MTHEEEDVHASFDVESVPLGSTAPHIVPFRSILPGRQRFLCYFIHRHLAFRLPEVQGLAELAYGE